MENPLWTIIPVATQISPDKVIIQHVLVTNQILPDEWWGETNYDDDYDDAIWRID